MPYEARILKRLYDAVSEVQGVLAEIDENYHASFETESSFNELWESNEVVLQKLNKNPNVTKLIVEEATLALTKKRKLHLVPKCSESNHLGPVKRTEHFGKIAFRCEACGHLVEGNN